MASLIEYNFVKRPKYVLVDQYGQIEEIFCKVCGTAIGGLTSKVIGTRMTRDKMIVEERETRFRRFHNYAELKMQFEDGSFHVTNGCTNCLSLELSPDQLHELHIADMEYDNLTYPGQEEHMARVALAAVAIRKDGGGIL